MKKLCCCVVIVAGLSGCGQSAHNSTQNIRVTTATGVSEGEAAGFRTIFTRADAEKILGEHARLSDSSTSSVSDTLIFQSSYTAIATDNKTGKTGNVYFMYEQYPDTATAHGLLIYYKTANEKNGAQAVTGMGDEAWFHTDRENFYFIMARKGNKMIRLKVNKVTATTSPDAFNEVAKRIVERM